MKGREGDTFYRALSKESIANQLATITKMGFSGIYLDKRGFSDQGESVNSELTQLIGPPLVSSDDGQLLFYKIR